MAKKPKKEKSQWAVLTPRQRPDGKWQVSLGIQEHDGKRKNPRRVFPIHADALQFCRDELARRKAHGEITAKADGPQVAGWLDLDARLIAAGAGSLQVVGAKALKDALAIQKTATAARCLQLYVATKGKSVYADDCRNRCGSFVRWFGNDRAISEANPEVMKAYFSDHPGATGRRTISGWLGWAADEEGYLPSNPCARKRRRKGVKKKASREAVILSPADAAALLRAAILAEDWISLSYIVLGFFAGLRPMELRKKFKGAPALNLEWDEVKSSGIEVRPRIAKTGAGRVVPILSPLPAWIDFLRERLGVLSGPILAVGKRGGGWRKNWKSFLDNHWPHPWSPDQLRHSFGSYRLAVVKNAETVALEMGNSPAVVLAHYWNWKTLAGDAATYWDLAPDVVMKQVKVRKHLPTRTVDRRSK